MKENQIRRAIRILVLVVLGCAGPAFSAPPRICDAAPALGLRDIHGAPVNLAAGKIVPWCQPCHQALRVLDRLATENPDKVQLILVDVGEPQETIAAFFADRPRPKGSIIALDSDGALAQRYGQRRFPTTFLIDESGRIRHINHGYGPGYAARVRNWLTRLLAGAPAGCP